MEGNSGKRKLSFKVAKTGLIFVTYIFHNYYFKNMLLLTKKKTFKIVSEISIFILNS